MKQKTINLNALVTLFKKELTNDYTHNKWRRIEILAIYNKSKFL